MAVKKAQQSRRLPSAQQDKTKGKEREVNVPPFKNPKNPGDNHLKHYGLETRTH